MINDKKYKLAILTSHPIQYQAPLFRKLSAHPNIDLTVYFCSDHGIHGQTDPGFGVTFTWDIPLLDGYRYKFLKNYSPNPSPSHLLGVINLEIFSELRAHRYDATILQGYTLLTNYLAYVAAWSTKTPVIFRGETLLKEERSLWRRAAKRMLLTWLFRGTRAFLPIGTRSREFYRHYGVPDDRLFLVPYAVDNDFFMSQAQIWRQRKAESMASLGIESDVPVILYASKMTERKRAFDLLKAFERLRHPAGLLFVGDGELRPRLEDYARRRNIPRVFFVGFKNQTELPKYYAMSDIFVLPSSYEPWGLVVNEAMCFSLPIVTTDSVAAATDLAHTGENGFVYPLGDIETLAGCLTELVADPDKRAAMGQRSLEIISKWNYDACTEGILKSLEYSTSAKGTS